MNRKALLAALGAALLAPAFAFAQATEKDGVLVNGAGMTLYTFDKDSGGKSACNGPCAGNWPPFTAAADAKPSGEYTVIARDDGARQWAHKGKPLYAWKNDKKPGDRTGDGFNNVWHAAKP